MSCSRGLEVIVEMIRRVGRGGDGGGDRRRSCGGGGGGGGGGLDSFDQSWHPEVAHGVLELLAVDVTFELLGVFLHASPPVVFDFVVSPSRQVLCNFGPSVAPARMKLKNEKLFFESDVATSNVRSEIVEPP